MSKPYRPNLLVMVVNHTGMNTLGSIFRHFSLFLCSACDLDIILFLKFTYSAFVKTMKFSFKFANCCSISILRCILAYLKSISGCLSMVSLPFFFLLLKRFPFQLNQYKQQQYLLIYIYWFLRSLLKK